MINRLELRAIHIPFRETFRHASAERTNTSSVWVEAASDAHVGRGEACPRPYVTGETIATARAFFDTHARSVRTAVADLASLRSWMTIHQDAIDANPAAWCAIELAVLDLMAKQAGQTIEAFLGVPPLEGRFRYTAVLGDGSPETFRAVGERYRRHQFTDFKIKLSGDRVRDKDKCVWLRGMHAAGVRVRADANNLWNDADEAIGYLRDLDYPFFALEEPVRAGQYDMMARIADALGCRVILDESFLRIGQIEWLRDSADRWIINVRVSKMGGLLRCLPIVEAARLAQIGLIVGAQVGETSLLTRAGLTVAALARDVLVAHEGAFGTMLLADDICQPPLMFAVGGLLDVADYPALHCPGLGVTGTPLQGTWTSAPD